MKNLSLNSVQRSEQIGCQADQKKQIGGLRKEGCVLLTAQGSNQPAHPPYTPGSNVYYPSSSDRRNRVASTRPLVQVQPKSRSFLINPTFSSHRSTHHSARDERRPERLPMYSPQYSDHTRDIEKGIARHLRLFDIKLASEKGIDVDSSLPGLI